MEVFPPAEPKKPKPNGKWRIEIMNLEVLQSNKLVGDVREEHPEGDFSALEEVSLPSIHRAEQDLKKLLACVKKFKIKDFTFVKLSYYGHNCYNIDIAFPSSYGSINLRQNDNDRYPTISFSGITIKNSKTAYRIHQSLLAIYDRELERLEKCIVGIPLRLLSLFKDTKNWKLFDEKDGKKIVKTCNGVEVCAIREAYMDAIYDPSLFGSYPIYPAVLVIPELGLRLNVKLMKGKHGHRNQMEIEVNFGDIAGKEVKLSFSQHTSYILKAFQQLANNHGFPLREPDFSSRNHGGGI